MKNETIRIGRNDLCVLEDRSATIDNLNRKVQILRKRQLLQTLKLSTNIRQKLLIKLEEWIDKLDKRLFSDESMATMPLDKILSLFKYVGNYGLKTMTQMNDTESILKEYLDTQNISQKFEQSRVTGTDEEAKQLKMELLRSFMDTMKKTAVSAIISQKEIENGHTLEKLDEDSKLEVVTFKKTSTPDLELEDIPEDLLKI
jgi:hypothetical protein